MAQIRVRRGLFRVRRGSVRLRPGSVRVRRDSVRVRRGSVRVRRDSVRCGVAQTVLRRQLAVRQAPVRISARHPRGGPLLSGSNEEIKSGTHATAVRVRWLS
jgi:hypothetical protein